MTWADDVPHSADPSANLPAVPHRPFAMNLREVYELAVEEMRNPPPGIQLLDWPHFNRFTGGLRPKEFSILCAPTACGKCLGAGTPVMLADGSVVPVESIRAGDRLMGPDSRPRRVLSTTSGIDELYEIRPAKGDPWVCNSAHVLSLIHTSTGEIEDVPLDRYLSASKDFRHLRKQFRVPVELSSPWPSELSPYFVGIWLGDGTTADQGVTKPDLEIRGAVEHEALRFGLKLSVYTDKRNGVTTWFAVGAAGKKNPIREKLREFGLGDEKRIPERFLRVDRSSRLELLAGILDTDGHQDKGMFEFTSALRGLADSVLYLARSLGFAAYLSSKRINGKDYWRILISGECSLIPTRIPRKRAPVRRQKKSVLRTGITVVPIGSGPYFGFTLDGDGRFLLGDFTVTHNTEFLASVSRQLLVQHVRHFVASVETGHTDWVKRVMGSLAGMDLNSGDPVPVRTLSDITLRFAPLIVDDILRLSLYDNRIPLDTLIADLTVMANDGCQVAILDNLNFFLEIVRAADMLIEMDRVVHELIMFCKRSPMHVILVMHPRKTLNGRVESEFDIKGSSTAVQEAQNVFLFNRPTKEDLEGRVRDMFNRELMLVKMRRRGRYMGSRLIFRYREGAYIEEGIG